MTKEQLLSYPPARVEWITPETAKEYLAHNKNNRLVSNLTVSNYARDMKNGQWHVNGEAIMFYEDGDLANGQHRLLACIKANAPFATYVVRGIPKTAMVMDRGRARSQVNILYMRGFGPNIADTMVVGAINFLFSLVSVKKISDEMLCDFINDNRLILDNALTVTFCGGTHPLSRRAPFVAATIVSKHQGIPDDTLSEFWKTFNSGFYETKSQTAAISLRNRYISKPKMNESDRAYAFAFATNAIRDYSKGQPRSKAYNPDIEPAFFAGFKPLLRAYLDDMNSK